MEATLQNPMKKLFLIATLLITIISFDSSAESNIFELPDFNSGKTVWMVKAGVSFNSAAGDWKDNTKDAWENTYTKLPLDASFPSQTGFDVSVSFNRSFSHRPLYWGMELGIGTRGYKANANWSKTTVSSGWGDVISHTVKQNITFSTYNIGYHPFIIGYKYQFLKNMAIDAHASAFVSFDIAGQQKIYNYDYQLSSNVPREKESTNKIKLSDMDGYHRFDAGLNIGIGYWFGHFNIDFSWQRGFINMVDSDDITYNAQSFKLKLGYAF